MIWRDFIQPLLEVLSGQGSRNTMALELLRLEAPNGFVTTEHLEKERAWCIKNPIPPLTML